MFLYLLYALKTIFGNFNWLCFLFFFLNFSWVKSCVVEETISRTPQTTMLDVFLLFLFNKWDFPKAKTQEKPLEEEFY